MKNKTTIATTMLSNPVTRYFFGEGAPLEHTQFEDPFSLSKKVFNCGHARSEVFLIEKRRELREESAQVTDLNASGIFRRIMNAPLGGFRKPKTEKNCHAGTRHVVSHFPAFSRLFPEGGLQFGKGYGLYWIRPLKVELTTQGDRGPSEGDRIISTFWIQFKNGTKGETGFMDLMKGNGGFSRWHIYPSGDVTSADLYPEHRNNHDAFRTLMANILQFEIQSEVNNAPRSDIRLTRNQRLGGDVHAAMQGGAPMPPIMPPYASSRQ